LVNLTRRINGGLNGYEDRLALYKRSTRAFGLWS
jgi:predicted chitinase